MKRREVLKISALGLAAASASCAGLRNPIRAQSNIKGFYHGVASGDPTNKSIILWTRATPISPGPIVCNLEVSLNKNFTNIVFSKKITTTFDTDYCVKYDYKPNFSFGKNKYFFYRFRSDRLTSDIGRAKLLDDSAKETSFAVMSCSNFPAGYFNVYEACAYEEIDFWIHLGDYLYEYPMDGYATENAQLLNRIPEPRHEILTLSDYRKRHAQYKKDPQSQLLHATHPLIAVWDDHEITNDTWKYGAENHDASEGSFLERKSNAIKAYLEWMPIRENTNKRNIYRSFKVGSLLNLVMLDTRQNNRDKQIDPRNYFSSGQFDMDSFYNDLLNKERKLIGEPQFSWLADTYGNSEVAWNILGQQVLMTKLKFPDISSALSNSNLSEEVKQYLPLLKLGLPSNLDAWDGYPAERDRIFSLFNNNNSKLISLAGDTHNAWFSKLFNNAEEHIGYEFGTPSVTSPGLSEYLNGVNPGELEQGIINANKEIKWVNTSHRGYTKIYLNESILKGTFKFIESVLEKSAEISFSKTFTIDPKS